MMRWWRPLLWAAVLSAGQVSLAGAQTLIVRNARAVTSVEVVYENAAVGRGAPDQNGTASIALTLAPGATERVVLFYVDRCQGSIVRVGAADRDRLVPEPPADCQRQDLSGLFVVRRLTSMVLDLAPTTPILLIRQGPPPPQWLRGDYTGDSPALVQPRGINLSAGVVLPRISKTFALACGDVAPCTATDMRPTLTVGGTYWLRNAVGVEVSLIRGATLTVKAEDTDFRFTHELSTDIVNVAGNLGGMFGVVRVYFRGGANFHRATTTVDQTIDDRTLTNDDGPVFIKGGTERFVTTTEGWGWMVGGGFEWWLKSPFAVYGEAAINRVQGADVAGGEAVIKDRVWTWTAGGRVHLGNPFGRRRAAPAPPQYNQPQPAP